MHTLKTALLTGLLSLAVGLSPTAAANTVQAAQARLEEAISQVSSLAVKARSASQLAQDVRPVLKQFLSFEKMTQRAIGPGWKQFTAAQKEEATRLFTTLVIRNYTEKYTLGENAITQYRTPQLLQPGRIEIPTRMLYRGSNYEVLYRMENLNGWMITDIVVEGVSFIANYRSQFDAQFKKGGVEAVLQSLRSSAGSSQ